MNSSLNAKTKPKIFITRPFPGPAIDLLSQQFDVSLNRKDRVLSRWQLKRAVRGVNAIVSLLTDKIDSEIMAAAGPGLKLIANYAVGFDNIDVRAATERKIVVTNTPGTLNDAVAEHTFALIISIARRIVEADRFTRTHQYRQWEPQLLLGLQLQGKTLGLIGCGRIGAGVAEIAQGFKMKTLYYDELRHKDLEKKGLVEYHPLETILEEADIISLHVPLTPTTRHLLSTAEFKLMKPTAIVVNTARGPVIDEAALIKALQEKRIWGAGLDVFEHEPKISRLLASLPNIVLTPHIGSATEEARALMSQMVADEVREFFATGRAINPVRLP